jgi:hypothetical protein
MFTLACKSALLLSLATTARAEYGCHGDVLIMDTQDDLERIKVFTS